MVRASERTEKMDLGRVPGAAWSREDISLPPLLVHLLTMVLRTGSILHYLI